MKKLEALTKTEEPERPSPHDHILAIKDHIAAIEAQAIRKDRELMERIRRAIENPPPARVHWSTE